MNDIETALEEILPFVAKPTRYLGCEVHSVRKDHASVSVRVALVFPEVYEIGMSTLGVKILYEIVNARADALAERAYQPWFDMESEMRRRGVPLFGLESKRPVREFDLVGFSLQAEQTYPGVLNCLDLAGIPLLAADRCNEDPLVVGGGPCVANPEPLADFFDFFLIGDGEEAIHPILDVLKESRGAGLGRVDTLRALCAIRGVYVPRFYDVEYDDGGRVRSVKPNDPAAPGRIERTWIDDLESAPYPEAPLVPLQEITQDRLAIEVLRGCTHGCRFCQAGYFYRPVRERSPERIREIAVKGIDRGGFDDLSLVSLSTADHSQVNRLARTVNEALRDRKVSISLPSLRIDTFSVHLAETVGELTRRGFTFAPEAGTLRLRRVINKPISEEAILETAEATYSRGWNLLKMYFMVGLPTETAQDVEGIADLTDRILAAGRRSGREKRIHVSVGAFVPKAFTPFQWEAMEDLDSLRSKIDLLRRRVHRGPARLKWHDPGTSVVEALLARGDRSVGRAVRRAWELGARFDGWSEHFSLDRWLEACTETGVDVRFQLRRRESDETLPWDHLDIGILKPFLRREREAAMEGRVTEDCRWGGCVACGIQGSGRDIVLTGNADAVPYGDVEGAGTPARGARRPHEPGRDPRATSGRPPGERIKVRFRYEKRIEARYLSHLDVARAFERALRTAGAPLAFTEGFTPRPRVSYGPPLSVGVMGANEVLDVELRERARLPDLAARMNAGLPGGIRVHSADYIPFLSPAPAAALTEADYGAAPAPALALDIGRARAAIAAFEKTAAFPITRRSPKGEKTLDARPIVAGIAAEELDGCVRLRLTLRTEGAGLAPRLVLQGILGLGEQDSHLLRITRTDLRPAAA